MIPGRVLLEYGNVVGECQIWPGSIDRDGYGHVAGPSRAPGTKRAHRKAWEDVHGPITPGLTVDHKCQVRACVNVDHLRLATVSENCAGTVQALRSTCAAGHEYTPETLVISTSPSHGRPIRGCRRCRRIWAIAARDRRRARAKEKT